MATLWFKLARDIIADYRKIGIYKPHLWPIYASRAWPTYESSDSNAKKYKETVEAAREAFD
jgi:hypothetical protein